MNLEDIKKIIRNSREVISGSGYRNYVYAVNEKIKKRDFKVAEVHGINNKEQSSMKIEKFDFLTNEQENILEKNMVWIFAPPRSGTTWLGSQLLVHPKNIIWFEPWIGFH